MICTWGCTNNNVATLMGYRSIGSRERPREFPGPFAFLDGGEIGGGFHAAIPHLVKEARSGAPGVAAISPRHLFRSGPPAPTSSDTDYAQ
jgi:hypothetical protein